MNNRLKEHSVGASLNLGANDLLIADILPKSLKVHVVKVIVSNKGEVEFAQWLSGVEDGFKHNKTEMPPTQFKHLREDLRALHHISSLISFPESLDYVEYENENRITLRFWFDHNEFWTFLPDESFFEDYSIDDHLALQYNATFARIVNALPIEWIDINREGGFTLF